MELEEIKEEDGIVEDEYGDEYTDDALVSDDFDDTDDGEDNFNGWNTASSGRGDYFSSDSLVTSDLTLYALWDSTDPAGKVTIYYSPNGGDVTSTTQDTTNTYNWTVDSSNNRIKLNGNFLTNVVSYNQKLGSDGLYNYNNSNVLYITHSGGYSATVDYEWVCLSGCTVSGRTFDQTVAYSSYDFCDASQGDCEVVVGVNWKTTSSTTTTINDDRYVCQGANKLAKLYVTTCTDGICSYNKKNGLTSSFGSWSLDYHGRPTWKIDQRSTVLWSAISSVYEFRNHFVDEGTAGDYTCVRRKVTIDTPSGLNCRATATTGDTLKIAYIDGKTVYAFASSTMYKDGIHWYYYSPANDCFMSSGKDDSWYVDIATHGKTTTTTTHGTCKCSDGSWATCSNHSLTTTSKCNNFCLNKNASDAVGDENIITGPATMDYSSCTTKKST